MNLENLDLDTLDWRKSSKSDDTGPSCVEVAPLPGGGAAIRDTKNPGGPVQTYTGDEWSAFVAGVRNNEFDF